VGQAHRRADRANTPGRIAKRLAGLLLAGLLPDGLLLAGLSEHVAFETTAANWKK